jgi:hypothetical protein
MPMLASAFIPRVPLRHKPRNIYSPLCRLSSSNQSDRNSPEGEDANSDFINNSPVKSKTTVARAGGRRPKTTSSKSNNSENNGFIAAVRQWALPLLALTLFLKFLLGMVGGGSYGPNVVYYSRSVYQSTTYTRDGNVETTRKENFQSNIPELVKRSQQKNNIDGGIDSRGFFDILDQDMEDEIDALLYQKW